MPNLNAIITAAKDPDLQERIAAAAGVVGVPNPDQFARQYAQSVVAQPQKGKPSDTLADAHAYKLKNTPPPLRPGQDPAAVTDDMILDSVTAVWTKLQTGGGPVTTPTPNPNPPKGA